MESLTKQQIVLLMIFISFVTSIATGIVTVSLIDQGTNTAPGVTQTINRIIERTVERVVTATSTPQIPVRETPVVTIEDLFAKATETSLRSIVHIRLSSGSATTTVGLATVISKNIIVTDKANIDSAGKYFIQTNGGQEIPATIIPVSNAGDIAYLHPDFATGTKNNLIPATIAKPNLLKLGQTVLMFGSGESFNVYQGILQNIGVKNGVVSSVTTDVGVRQTAVGSPLFNINGEFIGLKTTSLSWGVTNGAFFPASLLRLDADFPAPVIPVATSTIPVATSTTSVNATSTATTTVIATSTVQS